MADVPGYAALAESLNAQGLDVAAIKAALKAQKIETPSWGYANSGTRFKAFAWPGAARTTREKLDDAAMVHRMTGIAPSVAVHIPWDKPEDGDYTGMCQYAEQQGIAIGAVNPNVFQDDQYRLGSLGNPDKSIQESALDHMLECVHNYIHTVLGRIRDEGVCGYNPAEELLNDSDSQGHI
jgi:L-rhamnose isomerase/sugar isomerase